MDTNTIRANDWEKLIKNFSNIKALVIGDVMLDKYWFGDTNRISPEAPVPITKIESVDLRAGGAANVARNIASLGGQVSLLAITGDDEPSHELEYILNGQNINFFLIKDATISTTIKLRVIARNQQLIRIDFENTPGSQSVLELKNKFKEIVNNYDIVVLSDYDKGVLKHVSKLIQIADQYSIPILVDPKGEDYQKYTNAHMITPNQQELRAVVGKWNNEESLTQKAQNLRNQLNIHSLLLTRSEDGLSLFQDQTVEHQATVAKEVFDVSGAGDTVIASAALCVASGCNNKQLMKIANTAAGVVVAKVGTATCNLTELITELNNNS